MDAERGPRGATKPQPERWSYPVLKTRGYPSDCLFSGLLKLLCICFLLLATKTPYQCELDLERLLLSSSMFPFN